MSKKVLFKSFNNRQNYLQEKNSSNKGGILVNKFDNIISIDGVEVKTTSYTDISQITNFNSSSNFQILNDNVNGIYKQKLNFNQNSYNNIIQTPNFFDTIPSHDGSGTFRKNFNVTAGAINYLFMLKFNLHDLLNNLQYNYQTKTLFYRLTFSSTINTISYSSYINTSDGSHFIKSNLFKNINQDSRSVTNNEIIIPISLKRVAQNDVLYIYFHVGNITATMYIQDTQLVKLSNNISTNSVIKGGTRAEIPRNPYQYQQYFCTDYNNGKLLIFDGSNWRLSEGSIAIIN